MKVFNRKPICALMSAAVMGPALPALAQEASSVRLEEVVVTATKREESASDIPMNISAISGDALREQNITDLKKLLQESVEISAPQNGARFADSVTVRGLNVSAFGANNLEQFVRTTLAYYMDDTPLPHIGYRIKDIARVETLLGPQGTLYGAGSLGGTIRYITNKPSTEGVEVNLNTGVYQIGDGDLSSDTDLVVNLPVSDSFALRGSIAYLDEGGYNDRVINPSWAPDRWDNPEGGSRTRFKNDDWQEVLGGRLAALWQINDSMSLSLSYATQDQEAHGTPGASRQTVGQFCGDDIDCLENTDFRETPFQYDENTIVSRYEEFADRDFDLASVDFDWELGSFTIHSHTSVFEDSRVGQADYLSQGEWYYGWIPGNSLDDHDDTAFMTFDNTYEGLSHETRFTSTGEGPLHWIGGIYYTDQERTYAFSEFYPGIDQRINDFNPWGLPTRDESGGRVDEGYEEDLRSEYEEIALFGEVTYDVTEKLALTAGARFFDYEDVADTFIRDYMGPTSNDRQNKEDGSDSFYKLNAAYQFTDDVLAYATFSQGFRRGGTNGFRTQEGGQTLTDEALSYEPDSTDNYELGVKGYFMDRTLYVQTNLYRIDWNDVQTYRSQTIDGIFPINGTANGPDAFSQGWEAKIRWAMSENWTINYATAYTEAEWDDTKTQCLYEGGEANPDNDCRTWEKGGNLGGTPEWRHNLSLDFNYNLDNGLDVYGRLAGRYSGETPSDRSDSAEDNDSVFEYDSYTVVDASVGIASDKWNLSVWADNLLDDDTMVSRLSAGFVGDRATLVIPRTVGVNLSYNFF